MAKSPKKSVKFSDLDRSSPEASTSQSNPHSNESIDPETQDSVILPVSIITIPIHLVILSYSISQSDLSKAGIYDSLTKHFYYLVISQLIFSYLFLSNIQQTQAKKNRKKYVKFSISQDYNIILISLFISILLVVPLYIILVLFGAPFTSLIKETLILAFHLSILLYPVILAYLKVGFSLKLYRYLIGTVFGSWLGAVVIPLDWDRDWQNWPVSIVLGAYLGSVVIYSIGGLLP